MTVLYAGAEWIGPAYPDNFMVGRGGYTVRGLVVHHTASTFEQAVARFTSSSGVSGGGTSAHFIVRIDGSRYQVVDTADTAFADGDFIPNETTISIEHEQTWDYGAGVKTSDFTDAQYQSSHELCSILATDNGFPLDEIHVRPHSYYVATACPGDLDITKIIQGVEDMTPEEHGLLANLAAQFATPLTPGGVGDLILKKLDALAAAGVKTDNTAVLAAIADLKAHPDPAASAIAARIEAALNLA
jgi:hypothetical protein